MKVIIVVTNGGIMDSEQWGVLKKALQNLCKEFPDDLLVIGGVAVYLHQQKHTLPVKPEYTHDGDFLISQVSYSTLRDIEEVTPNPRLSKSQIIKNGYEFDIYVERHHKLAVPFDEAVQETEVIDGIRVVSPRHLLLLKLDAAIDREHTSKGDKDNRDIIKILALRPGKIHEAYLTDDRVTKLQEVVKLADPFIKITNNNAHTIKKLRTLCTESLNEVLGKSNKKGKGIEL